MGKIKGGHLYEVTCKMCGRKRVKQLSVLKTNRSTSHSSCSSLNIQDLNDGSSNFVKFYSIYQSMRKRTNDPNIIGFNNYGGRGINSDAYPTFEIFYIDQYQNYLEACKKFDYPSLERINVDGNY